MSPGPTEAAGEVEMHVQSILAKLDCRSRAEAVRKAAELGLLEPALEVEDATLS